MKRKHGYITVFFSLILVLTLSVILSAAESVRISCLKVQAQVACAMAMESLFSQYQPLVYERYGLFMMEEDAAETEFLTTFMQRNLESKSGNWFYTEVSDVTVTENENIAYNQFDYLENQIFDYMKYSYSIETIKDTFSRLSEETDREVSNQQNYLTEQLIEQDPGDITAEVAEIDEDEHDVQEVSDPRTNLKSLLKNPILQIVMNGEVSEAVLSAAAFNISGEAAITVPKSFEKAEDVSGSLENTDLGLGKIVESGLMMFSTNLYILDKFKNASQSDDQSSVLNYEVEYILFGNSEDSKNLEAMMNRLLLIRMLLNSAYLYQSSVKREAAHVLALMLATAIGLPILEGLIFVLLLAAWAYGEAIMDCRHLLGGKKVALFKTDESWALSLENLGSLAVSDSDGSNAKEDKAGLTYKDYLNLFLLGLGSEKKFSRMLNLIEANTRLDSKYTEFSIQQTICLYSVEVSCLAKSFFIKNPLNSDGFQFQIKRKISY